jgi:hypothetical protein
MRKYKWGKEVFTVLNSAVGAKEFRLTLSKLIFMQKTFSGLLGLTLLFASTTLQAQNQNQDEMMKAWEAYMTPGEMHKLLAASDGEWTADISMWMDPAGQPMKSTGTMTNKMIFDGRYQEGRYTGNMMGRQMEGMGITGYDNAKKQFESTWIDNMGSGMMKMTGTYDPSTKTITFVGNQVDPMTGKEMKVRETLQMVDDNNQTMTMYMTPDGASEFKTMEIKFKKK